MVDRSPTGELLLGNAFPAATLSRMRAAGDVTKLATGVHVRGGGLPVEKLARHHVWAIAEHYWPGAVITDRSSAGEIVDGVLFLAHPAPPRRADIALPGVMGEQWREDRQADQGRRDVERTLRLPIEYRRRRKFSTLRLLMLGRIDREPRKPFTVRRHG